jgi:DNA (cytosine-5)-methyltransferase 1
MIAGNFPHHLFEAYKGYTIDKTLGEILNTLQKDIVIDPIYGYRVPKNEVTDHILEEPLNPEELRLNREAKEYHAIYNGMSFPEKLDRPSRTITSTCTRVSRESLVIKNGAGYRRLTVRERGMLMGFPITYEYYGKSYNSKLKMIGNAIPPIVTYYLFQSMLEVPVDELTLIGNVQDYRHESPIEPIPVTPPDIVKFKYREVRSFRLAIPEYRFGSGVRFELSNKFIEDTPEWSVKFFYGSSKKINQVIFADKQYKEILKILRTQNIDVKLEIKEVESYSNSISSKKLQKRWTHKSQELTHPYSVLDKLSELGLNLKSCLSTIDISDSEFTRIVGDNLNAKLFDNKSLILSGILTGYIFNKKIKQ